MPSNTRITVERNKIGKEDMLLLTEGNTLASGEVAQTRAGQTVQRNPITARDIEYSSGLSIAAALENPRMHFPSSVKNILSSSGGSHDSTTLHITNYLDVGDDLADVPVVDEMIAVQIHGQLGSSGAINVQWKDRAAVPLRLATGAHQTINIEDHPIAQGDFILMYFANDSFRYLGTLGRSGIEDDSIANNLTTTEEGKVLDARQGPAIRNLISAIGEAKDVLSSNVDVRNNRTIQVNGYIGGGAPGSLVSGKVFIIKIPSAINVDANEARSYQIRWGSTFYNITREPTSTTNLTPQWNASRNFFKGGDTVAFTYDGSQNPGAFSFVANLTRIGVVDTTTSHSTTDALSANRGRAISLSLAETSNRSITNRNNIATNTASIATNTADINQATRGVTSNARIISNLSDSKLDKTPTTKDTFKVQGTTDTDNNGNPTDTNVVDIHSNVN